GLAEHAVESGNKVGVRERKHVTDVERSADRWRRGVDRIDLLAWTGGVESIDANLLPVPHPFGFKALEGRLVGNVQARAIKAQEVGRRSGHPTILFDIAFDALDLFADQSFRRGLNDVGNG